MVHQRQQERPQAKYLGRVVHHIAFDQIVQTIDSLIHCVRVATTASVFFRRIYQRCKFSDADPRSIAPATVYLAAKIEEVYLPMKVIFHAMSRLSGARLRPKFMQPVKWMIKSAFARTIDIVLHALIFQMRQSLVDYMHSVPSIADCDSAPLPLCLPTFRPNYCLAEPSITRK
jgi:hypothetical protein